MADETDLRPAQLRAVEALAGGSTLAEACAAAGVQARQLYRWRQLPAFDRALRDATRDAFADGLRVLAAGLRDAAAYLTAAAAGREGADPQRIAAARAVLTLAPAMREHVDLAERVEALEAAQSAADLGGGS